VTKDGENKKINTIIIGKAEKARLTFKVLLPIPFLSVFKTLILHILTM